MRYRMIQKKLLPSILRLGFAGQVATPTYGPYMRVLSLFLYTPSAFGAAMEWKEINTWIGMSLDNWLNIYNTDTLSFAYHWLLHENVSERYMCPIQVGRWCMAICNGWKFIFVDLKFGFKGL